MEGVDFPTLVPSHLCVGAGEGEFPKYCPVEENFLDDDDNDNDGRRRG